MDADPVRYGVVGCVGIGTTHADAVARSGGAELVACADVVEDHAREFGEERDCAWYTDHVEMVADAGVDAVSVCTPSGTHADLVVDLLEAGADVLCEKPLDVFAERVNAMVAAADRTGNTLAGVFQHRAAAGPRRVKQAIDGGELGRLSLADVRVKWRRTQEYYDRADWRGTREMDGGVLMNQAVHGIDTLQWLAGDVDRVHARVDTVDRDIEVEDTAVAAVEFEDDVYGAIEATTVSYPGSQTTHEVDGDRGSVRMESDEVVSFETVDGDVEVEAPDYEWGDLHAIQVQDFVDALREGREPMVPAREARKAVDVILAIYASSERGSPVSPAEFRV